MRIYPSPRWHLGWFYYYSSIHVQFTIPRMFSNANGSQKLVPWICKYRLYWRRTETCPAEFLSSAAYYSTLHINFHLEFILLLKIYTLIFIVGTVFLNATVIFCFVANCYEVATPLVATVAGTNMNTETEKWGVAVVARSLVNEYCTVLWVSA